MYSDRYLKALANCLRQTEVTLLGEASDLERGLDKCLEILRLVQSNQGTQFFLGNGASAAFAEHMALDWTKNGNIRSLSPSSWVLLSAISNDISFEKAFGVFLAKYAREGDVVVTISSSGNSANIIDAISRARDLGCQIITLSGLKVANASRKVGDVNFYVPAKTYGIVECSHQVILHMLLDNFMEITEWDRDKPQNMNVAEFQL